MQKNSIFSGILENIPYGEKNPFTVSVETATVLRVGGLAVALIVFGVLLSAYAKRAFA